MDEIVVQFDDTPELIIELTELTLDIIISDIKPEATIVLTELDEPDIIEIIPDLPFYVEVFEWPACPEVPPNSIALPISSINVEHNSIRLDQYLNSFKSVHGGIFITNITPTNAGNVSEKITSSAGLVLDSCILDTKLITVSIIAITGHSNFVPNVTVNNLNVSLVASIDRPIFTGSIDLDVTDCTNIVARHEDGAVHICNIAFELQPVVLSASFSSTYINDQTELKANDTHKLSIVADSTVVKIEVADYGACVAQSFNVNELASFSVDVRIADRGVIVSEQKALVRVQKTSGSWSDWTETSNTIKLNNLYPSIVINSITYPNSQQALKNTEQAVVNNIVSNFNTIEYIDILGELSIPNKSVYEPSKLVSRLSGTYNVSNANIKIRAIRLANGAVKEANATVNIANVQASISITSPYSRLRSGGNNGTTPQVYLLTLQSNQKLLTAPSVNIPEGSLLGTSFVGSGTTWTRQIQIHDNDTKGIYSFNSLQATNLAGIVTTNITSTYTIGGFVFRVLTVPAYPNREVTIGTEVVNTAKLRCTNLSKGASGSLNYIYIPTVIESSDKYTINSNSIWYNCDGANASSNTTGLMQIELEEVV